MLWLTFWAAEFGFKIVSLFDFDFCLFGFFSGHGSFSSDPKLNSVVGHLLHSSILVPYHGWYVNALKI
jgi:omega-3 fatty acid desaturase (delta-15 desaturase)